MLRQELGYSILCLRSSILSKGIEQINDDDDKDDENSGNDERRDHDYAGRGVFVDGCADAGSVMAFQPGEIWPKEYLIDDKRRGKYASGQAIDPTVYEHFAKGTDENYQVSIRFDEYVVDSRQSPVTVLCEPGTRNPWALGHVINHPPENVMPNCQSLMLNFTESMDLWNEGTAEEPPLSMYLPNAYARFPSWKSQALDFVPTKMHGLCLIARRDVSDEELVYDYRLQTDTNGIDWYNVVQYGEDDILRDDDHQDGIDQIVFFRDDWRKGKNP